TTTTGAVRPPVSPREFPLDRPDAHRLPDGAPPPADDPARPTVEIHTATGWRPLGTLNPDGWTELPAGLLADAVRLSDADGVRELVPWFAEPPRVTADRTEIDAEAGGAPVQVTVSVSSGLPGELTAAISQVAPAPVGRGEPAAPGGPGRPAAAGSPRITVAVPRQVALPRGATVRVPLRISVPAGTAPGTRTVPVRFTVAGRTVERRLTVTTHPRTGGPDLVPGSAAASSADETPDFPASAVADGDPATRWSSPVDDNSWVQVELAAPAKVGRVVLHWQDAYAARYRILTSTDGVTWHTAATVTDGDGGRETVWLDAPADTRFLRMQGERRATKYGYSLYGMEAYAAAG
ncbi:hyaluronoglucosaminidase, partial [Streptomyces sp. DvalAA-14]|uniref:discoidin domain-containing protein n=1 Tax=unclassified Streptomyces TaxID=2593676 RepID=UPI00081B5C23